MLMAQEANKVDVFSALLSDSVEKFPQGKDLFELRTETILTNGLIAGTCFCFVSRHWIKYSAQN